MTTPTALMKATSPDRIHAAMLRAIATPESTQAELAALKVGKDTLDLSAVKALEAKKLAIRAQRDANTATAAAEAAIAALAQKQAAHEADKAAHAQTVQDAAASLNEIQASHQARAEGLDAVQAQLTASTADLKEREAKLAAAAAALDADQKLLRKNTETANSTIASARLAHDQIARLIADQKQLAADHTNLAREKAEFEAWRTENTDALAAARKILGVP